MSSAIDATERAAQFARACIRVGGVNGYLADQLRFILMSIVMGVVGLFGLVAWTRLEDISPTVGVLLHSSWTILPALAAMCVVMFVALGLTEKLMALLGAPKATRGTEVVANTADLGFQLFGFAGLPGIWSRPSAIHAWPPEARNHADRAGSIRRAPRGNRNLFLRSICVAACDAFLCRVFGCSARRWFV